MTTNEWPNLNDPLGFFVLRMHHDLERCELTPMQIRAWKIAWNKKSKWYRNRKFISNPIEWSKSWDIPISKSDIIENWLIRGDSVIEEFG